jgi:DNA-binding winged helix-turn-helix (wHTH) protein
VLPVPSDICVGELQIRPREHTVIAHGQEVPLTSREFDIVMMLAEHPGWVFSSNQLAGESDEGDYSPESVSVLVSRLRQKLAAAGASDVVETVRGIGYRLHASAVPCEEPSAATAVRRELRDASWQLNEAVFEVEHSGTVEQQLDATDALVRARHAIYSSLAE